MDQRESGPDQLDAFQGLGAGRREGYKVLFGEGDVPWKKVFAAAEKTRRRRVLPDRAGRQPLPVH